MRSARFLRIFLFVWNILAYGVDSFNIKLTPLSVIDLVTYDNQSLSQSTGKYMQHSGPFLKLNTVVWI